MYRVRAGISQTDLGQHLGITFQQIQKYERGINRIGASRLQKISELLKIPVSSLFDDLPGSERINTNNGDEGDIPTTLIQPIGLLVNELVTNAAKHGAGKIDVAYRAGGRDRTLVVCDRGSGLPSDFDLEKSETGLGMKVIRLLAKQLRGTITAEANPSGTGACFTVKFPI
jgi:two-component sensor histidine kinase